MLLLLFLFWGQARSGISTASRVEEQNVPQEPRASKRTIRKIHTRVAGWRSIIKGNGGHLESELRHTLTIRSSSHGTSIVQYETTVFRIACLPGKSGHQEIEAGSEAHIVCRSTAVLCIHPFDMGHGLEPCRGLALISDDHHSSDGENGTGMDEGKPTGLATRPAVWGWLGWRAAFGTLRNPRPPRQEPPLSFAPCGPRPISSPSRCIASLEVLYHLAGGGGRGCGVLQRHVCSQY